MSKARSLNKVMLIGNITRDPITKTAGNGVPFCAFGLATNTSWTDKETGETKERTEYHNLIAFSKLAEICAKLLATGMMVYIEGEIRNRIDEDVEGRKSYRTDIKIEEVIIINSKGREIDVEEVADVADNFKPEDLF
jgi:single-strand DNA-binding protein